jgi:predicted PurR-regulated permease PerM
MSAIVIVGPLLLGAVLWLLLDRHERRRAEDGLPRHSPLRLVFASAGLLLLLFAGGCGALFAANMDNMYVTWQSIGIFAGPPLAVGALVAWLALRRKKASQPAP